MTKIGTKRKIPPPDLTTNNSKKQHQDPDVIMLSQEREGLTKLITEFGKKISGTPPALPSNVSSSSTQPMLSAIELALRETPEYAKIRCLIGILQYINNFNESLFDNTISSEESH